jgi:hypothetical protein
MDYKFQGAMVVLAVRERPFPTALRNSKAEAFRR